MSDEIYDDEMTQFKLALHMIKSEKYNEDQLDSLRKLYEDANHPANLAYYTEEEEEAFVKSFADIPLILEALEFLHAEFYKHKNDQEILNDMREDFYDAMVIINRTHVGD